MDPTTHLLLTLGAILLASALTRAGADRLRVPQVSLLMLLGVAAGPLGLDLVPAEARSSWYPFVAELTLAMVGFLLGGEFSVASLRAHGRAVLAVSLSVALLAFGLVFGAAWATGLPAATALVLGCAAMATDPAAVQSVVTEAKAEGPLTRTLLGVVAVDDVWGILVFSGVLAVLTGDGPTGWAHGLLEAGGSLALGAALGLAMALTTGRVSPGTPTAAEGAGFVLIASGLAEALGLSYLLTAVSMGAVVTNVARHHTIAFREIEGIEWPLLVVFFVLSGATIDADAATSALPGLAVYVVARTASRLLAGQLGAQWGGLPATARPLGLALLPQAGVALAVVLVVTQRLPEVGQPALAIVVLGTVVFEVVGPVLTRWVLSRAGELPSAPR